jgi:hypothetical protein
MNKERERERERGTGKTHLGLIPKKKIIGLGGLAVG